MLCRWAFDAGFHRIGLNIQRLTMILDVWPSRPGSWRKASGGDRRCMPMGGMTRTCTRGWFSYVHAF